MVVAASAAVVAAEAAAAAYNQELLRIYMRLHLIMLILYCSSQRMASYYTAACVALRNIL